MYSHAQKLVFGMTQNQMTRNIANTQYLKHKAQNLNQKISHTATHKRRKAGGKGHKKNAQIVESAYYSTRIRAEETQRVKDGGPRKP